jgi:hypothetical protein
MSFPPDLAKLILSYCDFRNDTLDELLTFIDYLKSQDSVVNDIFGQWLKQNPISGFDKVELNLLMKAVIEFGQIKMIHDMVCEVYKNYKPKFFQELVINKVIEEVIKERLLKRFKKSLNHHDNLDDKGLQEIDQLLVAMRQDNGCITGSLIISVMFPGFLANDIDIFLPEGATRVIQLLDSNANFHKIVDPVMLNLYRPLSSIPISNVHSYHSKIGIIQVITVQEDPREHITKWFDLNIVKNYYDGHHLVIGDLKALVNHRIEIREIPASWDTPAKALMRLNKYTGYLPFKVYIKDLNLVPRNPNWPHDMIGTADVPRKIPNYTLNDIDRVGWHTTYGINTVVADAIQPRVMCNGKSQILTYTEKEVNDYLGGAVFTVFDFSKIPFVFNPDM